MSDTRVRAPELPDNLTWFNVKQAPSLAALRGRVVLLFFWSASSVDCLRMLADLRYLESRFGADLALIGVHSPKLGHEQADTHVQKAINRWHMHFPVLNDPDLQLWRLFRAKSWPTLIYIDPDGAIVGVLRDAGKRKKLEKTITDHLAARPPACVVPVVPQLRPEAKSIIKFPAKLYAAEGRLYISDSGRNRILETDHLGRIRRSFGSGSPGLVDGASDYASFTSPQGLIRVGDDLYVADAGNHAIRRVRLASGDVETVVAPDDAQAEPDGLCFPWDLAYRNGALYIAMAGSHQIRKFTLNNQTLTAYAGQALAGLVDGPVRGACFAQPMGVALYNEHLFIADTANATIRMVRLQNDIVATIVGSTSGEPGDREGLGSEARLQYPAGIAIDPARELLWIADSYNGKLKLLSLQDNRVRDYPLEHPLDEAGGLSVVGDSLFIANTNAHQILRVDLAQRSEQVIDIDEAE